MSPPAAARGLMGTRVLRAPSPPGPVFLPTAPLGRSLSLSRLKHPTSSRLPPAPCLPLAPQPSTRHRPPLPPALGGVAAPGRPFPGPAPHVPVPSPRRPLWPRQDPVLSPPQPPGPRGSRRPLRPGPASPQQAPAAPSRCGSSSCTATRSRPAAARRPRR